MDKMNKFSYPACSINPKTEKPFPRHKWEIVGKEKANIKVSREGMYHYAVRCVRCGLNDPKPPLY